MAEIIKAYRQSVPAMRFIGKKYGDEDRVDGGFGAKWGEWFQNNLFASLEKLTLVGGEPFYEDADAYIGLMRWKEGEPFEYWIGMFAPENTTTPEGFGTVNFPASTLGVCWVCGKGGEVFFYEDRCAGRLKEEGYAIVPDEKGAFWCFERYACPRFTTPDEQGNIILDICIYIKNL